MKDLKEIKRVSTVAGSDLEIKLNRTFVNIVSEDGEIYTDDDIEILTEEFVVIDKEKGVVEYIRVRLNEYKYKKVRKLGNINEDAFQVVYYKSEDVGKETKCYNRFHKIWYQKADKDIPHTYKDSECIDKNIETNRAIFSDIKLYNAYVEMIHLALDSIKY